MKYVFKKPFKYGTETIESVELREEYTAGDMMRISNCNGKAGDVEGAIAVAATGWPLQKIAAMPLSDYKNLLEKVAPFLGLLEEAGQAT